MLRAAAAPVYGRWRVVLFEDADRATEQAANALLKAIEEPAPRTVWLLCAPSADDLPTTIRSRCRLVTLRTPPTSAVAEVLVLDGVGREQALEAARAAQGHIGRARRLATDPEAARRRAEVLQVPLSRRRAAAASATHSPRRPRWSLPRRRRRPQSPKSLTCQNATRCAGRSAKVRPVGA